MVGTEDGAHALAAAGAEQTGEAVDFALFDAEIIGTHARGAGKALGLVDRHGVGLGLIGLLLHAGEVVQLLAHHLRDQLDLRQLLDGVFAHQLAVAQHGDAVADGVDLLEEVGDEDDAHAARLQVAHEAEKHLDFLFIQRRGRLVEDEHLAVHVHGASDGDHLLHGQGAVAQLLLGARGDAEALQDLIGAFFARSPIDERALVAGNEYVLCHGEVRAEGDLLIHCADADSLRVLRRADGHVALHAFDVDRAGVAGIHAREHLDQRRLSRAVLAHQRVDLALAQGKVHVLQRFHAREGLADLAHGQDNSVFHLPFPFPIHPSCARKGSRGAT